MTINSSNPIFSFVRDNQQEVGDQSRQTLREFSTENNPVLLQIKTVFPFTLFPDVLKIDLQKISITHIDFLWTHKDQVIAIDDVLGVSVRTGPLFATLHITTRFFAKTALKIAYLHRADAMLARRIIQGLMIVLKQNIKIIETDKDEIVKMLQEVGKIR